MYGDIVQRKSSINWDALRDSDVRPEILDEAIEFFKTREFLFIEDTGEWSSHNIANSLFDWVAYHYEEVIQGVDGEAEWVGYGLERLAAFLKMMSDAEFSGKRDETGRYLGWQLWIEGNHD